MQVNGSNSREDKVRRFLQRLPDGVDRVRAELVDGDVWEVVHVIPLPVQDPTIAARDACSALQDACNMAGRRVKGRIAAWTDGDSQPLVQRTQHDPDPDAVPTDTTEMDGSRESIVSQMQRHVEGSWRIGLQERHHMRVGFQEVLEQQGRVIEKLTDLCEASMRREGEARDMASQLWEMVLEQRAATDEEDGDGDEMPLLQNPIEQVMAAVKLLGSVQQMRRAKKKPEAEGEEPNAPTEPDNDVTAS